MSARPVGGDGGGVPVSVRARYRTPARQGCRAGAAVGRRRVWAAQGLRHMRSSLRDSGGVPRASVGQRPPLAVSPSPEACEGLPPPEPHLGAAEPLGRTGAPPTCGAVKAGRGTGPEWGCFRERGRGGTDGSGTRTALRPEPSSARTWRPRGLELQAPGLTGSVGLSSHPFLALGRGFPACPWAERPCVV